MPAFTPNRNYPYSVPTDPTDVGPDIQRLAEAIDTDVSTLMANVPFRPAVRLRGTDALVAATFPPLNPGEGMPFDTVDFNTGIQFLYTGDADQSVRILTPGHYFVIGTVAIPRPTSGVSRNMLRVSLLKNTVPISENASHLQPSASDGIRVGYASMNFSMNGTTDTVALQFSSTQPTAVLDQYTVTERTLTLIRMSPTP